MVATMSLADLSPTLAKAPTGIRGLDQITSGGVPMGRPTLLCGGPGSGKTVLAMQFLVRGAQEFGEPGLFVSFEGNSKDLVKNFNSFGFDIGVLLENKELKILTVELSRGRIVEAGDFSLEALLIRLEQGILEINAKRVVLDGLETIFSALSETASLRNEVAGLFQWLRDRDVTTIVTGERDKENLTRHGFEEYISDCVILLDHRVTRQISKRLLRVIKYRGSTHAEDEFPFLIEETGLSIFPITSTLLEGNALTERVSTGIRDLDAMLGGKGYYKGTTTLISGKAGTGKSSLAVAFACAVCEGGERCLYYSLEESAAQITRNMRSVGIDVEPALKKGVLIIQAFRPTLRGLEGHLMVITHAVERFRPTCVVLDPITNFASVGEEEEIKSMLIRTLDKLKQQGVTLVFTALTPGSGRADETGLAVSSLIDTWIALDLQVVGDVRRREIHIVKSRGMEHSQQTRELVMSSHGLSLRSLKGRNKHERPGKV